MFPWIVMFNPDSKGWEDIIFIIRYSDFFAWQPIIRWKRNEKENVVPTCIPKTKKIYEHDISDRYIDHVTYRRHCHSHKFFNFGTFERSQIRRHMGCRYVCHSSISDIVEGRKARGIVPVRLRNNYLELFRYLFMQ